MSLNAFEQYKLNEQLVEYSRIGDLMSVKNCLSKGADVNYANNSDVYQWLCENNHIGENDLHKFHADDICTHSDEPHTDDPFITACMYGQIDLVKWFVNNSNANIHARHDLGLRKACWKKHINVVRYLIEECNIIPDEYSFTENLRAYAIGRYIISTDKYVPNYNALYLFMNNYSDKNECLNFIGEILEKYKNVFREEYGVYINHKKFDMLCDQIIKKYYIERNKL
jgi:hypothetical protein